MAPEAPAAPGFTQSGKKPKWKEKETGIPSGGARALPAASGLGLARAALIPANYFCVCIYWL